MRRGTYTICILVFLTLAVACELMPLAFGTGHAAYVDWAFPYITLRFVVLPASAVGLVIWGTAAFLSSLRRRQAALPLVPLLVIPFLFLGLSWFVPLPWLVPLIHGDQRDVPGWIR